MTIRPKMTAVNLFDLSCNETTHVPRHFSQVSEISLKFYKGRISNLCTFFYILFVSQKKNLYYLSREESVQNSCLFRDSLVFPLSFPFSHQRVFRSIERSRISVEISAVLGKCAGRRPCFCMPVDLPQRGRNRLKGRGVVPLNSPPVNRV